MKLLGSDVKDEFPRWKIIRSVYHILNSFMKVWRSKTPKKKRFSMTFYIAFVYHVAMLSTLAINTTNQTLNIYLSQIYFILFFCYTFRPTRSSSLSLLSMILDGTQMYLLCVYKEHIKTFLFITYDIYSLFVNFRKLSTPFFTTLCKPCVVE